jgi:hypothetical protein
MQAHEMSSLTHADSAWPPEVGLILSALEAGAFDGDQRQQPRRPYRVKAMLRLFIDPPGASPWQLFTRDASPRGLGFISHHMLPLSHGGIVELLGPNGQEIHAHCTLLRCREASPGWMEGALHFNREQWCFAELQVQPAPPSGESGSAA